MRVEIPKNPRMASASLRLDWIKEKPTMYSVAELMGRILSVGLDRAGTVVVSLSRPVEVMESKEDTALAMLVLMFSESSASTSCIPEVMMASTWLYLGKWVACSCRLQAMVKASWTMGSSIALSKVLKLEAASGRQGMDSISTGGIVESKSSDVTARGDK